MDDHAQQSNGDSSDLHMVSSSQTSVAEQLLALSPNTTGATIMRHSQPTQTTAPPSEISTFLASLTAHYAARSDTVTPHNFAQCCKDYHTGKCGENAFYVSVYRLLVATDAQHLMEGFKAFLPRAWKNMDLGWLDRSVEEDVRREAKDSKERTAILVAMMKGAAGEVSTSQADGDLLAGNSNDTATPKRQLPGEGTEALAQKHTNKKRKTPINAFRSTPKVPSPLVESSTTSPDSTPAPAKKASNWLSGQNQQTPTPTKPPPHTPATPSSATKPTALVVPILRPSLDRARDLTPRPTRSASPATNTIPLPPASTIPHLGPIYRDKRQILSRPHTKPYIHALCGQRFGHPNEVQRHHNGQGGRPGCWEKRGKPADGEGGKWDEHVSCKVRLTDLRFVRVREGWVVVSWGSVGGVEGLREGEEGDGGVGGGADAGAGHGAGDGAIGGEAEPEIESKDETGNKRKKVMVKLKFTKHTQPKVGSGEDARENGDDKVEDGCLAGFVDSQSSPERAEKRQKIFVDAAAGNDSTAAASLEVEANAAARAVALGLRTRK